MVAQNQVKMNLISHNSTCDVGFGSESKITVWRDHKSLPRLGPGPEIWQERVQDRDQNDDGIGTGTLFGTRTGTGPGTGVRDKDQDQERNKDL